MTNSNLPRQNQNVIDAYLNLSTSALKNSTDANAYTGFMGVFRDPHTNGLNESLNARYSREFASKYSPSKHTALKTSLVKDIVSLLTNNSKSNSVCKERDKKEIGSSVELVYSQMVDEIQGNYISLRQGGITTAEGFDTSIEPLATLVTAVQEKDITKHPFYASLERYNTQGKVNRILPEVHFTPRQSTN